MQPGAGAGGAHAPPVGDALRLLVDLLAGLLDGGCHHPGWVTPIAHRHLVADDVHRYLCRYFSGPVSANAVSQYREQHRGRVDGAELEGADGEAILVVLARQTGVALSRHLQMRAFGSDHDVSLYGLTWGLRI